MTVIPILIGTIDSHKSIGKETGGIVNESKRGDHPNYSIIYNGQNTGNSPEDLKRLAVSQTPLEDHYLTLV